MTQPSGALLVWGLKATVSVTVTHPHKLPKTLVLPASTGNKSFKSMEMAMSCKHISVIASVHKGPTREGF